MLKRLSALLIAALILILTGCFPNARPVIESTATSPPPTLTDTPVPPPTDTPIPPTVTPTPFDPDQALAAIAADYPLVEGSTSTHPLQTTVACTILEVHCRWHEPFENIFNERRYWPDPAWEESPELVEKIQSIWHNGTHSSYLSLIEGRVDLILVARKPSQDEETYAREMGVEFDTRPIALDAFVFLLHVDNPVDELPLSVIHDIYTGDITTWAEATGGVAEGDIHTYQRNLNSGNQELMEQLVMKGDPMVESPELILETMMGPIHALGGDPLFERAEGDPLGIGYSVYYYAAFIFPHEKVKLIAVVGVQPTSDNIASRDYPLWTEVYVVVRADQEPGSTALLLRDWLLTEDGQAAIAESGYVPIR